MKLETAIEVKKQYYKKYKVHMLSKEREADRLSIKALERVTDMRISPCTTADEILLGETED